MESHPLRMRGLKLSVLGMSIVKSVASFTDARIETPVCGSPRDCGRVASFTDAWIETIW